MKKGTKRGREEISIGIDRISSLPDEILIHILSFLSTKNAVQTCILSKRWSNVWASVPFLKVGQQKFRFDSDENQREPMDKFVQFVNGVLESLKLTSLDTFECFFSNSDRQNHSAKCLGHAAALMPRVFVFYGNIPKCLDLPESVFSCASLQNLKLHSNACGKIIRPELINIPSLKVLQLVHVELNDDFAQKFFSGCPAIESLVLSSCALGISDITSDVLKMLNIDNCHQSMKMRISCPVLVSLFISIVNPREGILLENMASLATVDIKLHNCSCDMSILRGLSNVTTVKLGGSLQSMEQLEKDIPYCKTFNNLKILEFGEWDMTINFDLVAWFLKNSPNLQKLYFQLGKQSHGHTQGQPRQEAMRDVLSKLEYVELVKISGGKKAQDNKLVKILRRHIKTIGHLVIL